MNILPLSGRARLLGDDVNTDYIISSRRKKETIDPSILCGYMLEDVDPGFAGSVRASDILVAGNNFGCGSAMEVAVTAVLAAGIRAVVAKSFSRTYMRNAMNNGLLPVIADTTLVREGDVILLALDPQGRLLLDNHRDILIECAPIEAFMLEMLDLGGLVPYLREHGGFQVRS
jgi:3-isopropylmalate/(R)-2-methylmalate dehydratase small subunit